MRTDTAGREARRGLVWRPARSYGALVGGALVGLSAAGLGVLEPAFLASNAFETRLLAAGLAAGLGLVLAAAVWGTWRIGSLQYVLGPTAFEIRCGLSRTRVRYEWIDGVASGRDDADTAVATLWPGAHLGCRRGPRQRLISRATVGDASRLVVVETRPAAYAVSPTEPKAFCAALVARVREAGPAEWQRLPQPLTSIGLESHPWDRHQDGPAEWQRLPAACSLLDRVAAVDAPLRALALLAMAVAILGLVRDVAHAGQVAPEALVAGAVLALNTALGPVLEARLAGLGRLLLSAALALQVLAAVW